MPGDRLGCSLAVPSWTAGETMGKPPPVSHHEKPKEAHQVPFWAWMFASENPWPLGDNGESLAVVVVQKTR